MKKGKLLKVIEKYLQKYAEPLAHNAIDIPGEYDFVAVIPAYDETSLFLQQPGFAQNGNNLVVLVVNAPEEGGDKGALIRTKLLLDGLSESMVSKWCSDTGLELFYNEEYGYSLLAVDCVSDGKRIPVKMGVGLARKIGADIAVNLIHYKKIRSPIIYSTDADVQIPDGYFSALADSYKDSAGYVYSFAHGVEEERLDLAMQLYELSLHYYVAGLEYAGSSYAFHTIGSCLAFDYQAYAHVRGFPRRAAGEDFYLLNKLAKVGNITSLSDPVIKVAGRGSERVPFGTGPAINKITQFDQPMMSYKFYNPVIFEYLRTFMQVMPKFFYNNNAAGLIPEVKSALKDIGFLNVVSKLRDHAKNEAQFLRSSIDWFDAFKTLKFIHYMRDNGFPSVLVSELRCCDFVSDLIVRYPTLFEGE